MEALLQFEDWSWLIDHLWRDIAPSSAIEAAVPARSILLKTLWPGTLPGIENAFKDALSAWSNYVINFETACEYRKSPEFLMSSHIQPWMSGPLRVKAERLQDEWSEQNGKLLYAYVRALNHMIDAVRKDLLPTYRQDEGYFLIHDDLGYRTGGESKILRPL